jgi:hypothetical protein
VISAIWTFVKPHIFYWIAAGVLFVGFRSWIGEHDARLRAEIGVQQAQTQIDSLKQQIATRQVETEKEVQVVVKEVQAAKTPEQQLAEIPKLETQPLNAQPLPDAPNAVKVDIQPLVTQLAECKTDAIQLASCRQEIADRQQIELQQDAQVSLLKKKPGFWHRVGSGAKKYGIGIAVGAAGILIARGIH